jgi:hypothetical protein
VFALSAILIVSIGMTQAYAQSEGPNTVSSILFILYSYFWTKKMKIQICTLNLNAIVSRIYTHPHYRCVDNILMANIFLIYPTLLAYFNCNLTYNPLGFRTLLITLAKKNQLISWKTFCDLKPQVFV